VGTDEEPVGEIPAVGVSSEVGSRLARRFDGESITLSVEADIHPRRARTSAPNSVPTSTSASS